MSKLLTKVILLHWRLFDRKVCLQKHSDWWRQGSHSKPIAWQCPGRRRQSSLLICRGEPFTLCCVANSQFILVVFRLVHISKTGYIANDTIKSWSRLFSYPFSDQCLTSVYKRSLFLDWWPR